MIEAVLFDLDGTLADTAPDLGGALNRLREEEGLAPLAMADMRPHVSGGTRGLLRIGFALSPEDEGYRDLAKRFLAHYQDRLCEGTCLFPGIAELLDALEKQAVKWGVVTNKPERFALPLIECLGLASRAACVIGGDSAGKPKPDPAPLLLGCATARVAPGKAIYVGDDLRDIVAGRAAGMRTVTAAYGYLGVDDPPETWRADAIIREPSEILGLLGPTC